MKKILLLLLVLSFGKVQAQEDSLSTLTLNIGQDSYFGFYLSGLGSTPLARNIDLTFYGNYWTNPAFGNAALGTDFWTEVGGGINFSFLDHKAYINPSLGFTYGKVLSGGEKGVVGDGIVPGVFVGFSNNRFDMNSGVLWYGALRKEGPVSMDFLWWWFSPGYKFNHKVTAGVLVEELVLSRITDGSSERLYLWLGPYVQFSFRNGAYIKAASGYDTVNKSFMKLNLNIPLINR